MMNFMGNYSFGCVVTCVLLRVAFVASRLQRALPPVVLREISLIGANDMSK